MKLLPVDREYAMLPAEAVKLLGTIKGDSNARAE